MNIYKILAYIREQEERAEKAERERDKDIKALSEQARLLGEAEGKLAASEMAGVVEGWKARAEAAEAKVERLREPDWWWRDLDPDDSGDTPHEALRNLPDFTVSHLRSSYIGPDKFAVRVPVLDQDSDDDEVLLFDTEQEALDASKERRAALAAMEATDE